MIDKEGGFRKASEKLFKARSAVSYSVKQVEAYYQVEIFSRDSYKPQLTKKGKILLSKIRLLLEQANEFDVFASQMNNEIELELRLGVTSLFAIDKITDLLHELKLKFPHTIIHLEIEIASGEAMLIHDKVDIGIYGIPAQSPLVDYKQIDDCELPLLISKDFPLATKGTVELNDLKNFPQVVAKSSYNPDQNTTIPSPSLNEQRWYVSDQSTKKILISKGLGWGRLPKHEIEAELQSGELIEIKTTDLFILPIYVAKLKNKALGPVALAIWNYFNNI
ncbi:MAG: LysR family transcriptional regulator [Pseudomonadales bacterium]|nr:LysR family transcriptional regulator [Pseudomonadales bacterium]